jgi:hypothetical protein
VLTEDEPSCASLSVAVLDEARVDGACFAVLRDYRTFADDMLSPEAIATLSCFRDIPAPGLSANCCRVLTMTRYMLHPHSHIVAEGRQGERGHTGAGTRKGRLCGGRRGVGMCVQNRWGITLR